VDDAGYSRNATWFQRAKENICKSWLGNT
jgi:hypothetical protein